MPTMQETFDTVVEHLRRQGRKAIGEELGCSYRTDDGLKCAAGCLIPDTDYREEFEGTSVSPDQRSDGGVTGLLRRLGHDVRLVSALQEIHDNHDVGDWEGEFEEIASEFGLTYTPPGSVAQK